MSYYLRVLHIASSSTRSFVIVVFPWFSGEASALQVNQCAMKLIIRVLKQWIYVLL